MIEEIDDALRSIIRDEVLDGGGVEVLFDAPTTEWSSRRNGPAVNLYLYDIREDMSRHTYGTIEGRDGAFVVGRQRTPRYFLYSYLVTAWTQRPEDEHRLLSRLLLAFLEYEVLPRERLGPVLGSGPTVGVGLAQPPSQDRALSDIWSSLGGELKPSLDVVVIAAAPYRVDTAIAPPVLDDPKVVVKASDYENAHAPRRRRRRSEPAEPPSRGARSTVRRGGRVVTIADRTDDGGAGETGGDVGRDAGPDVDGGNDHGRG